MDLERAVSFRIVGEQGISGSVIDFQFLINISHESLYFGKIN